MTPAGQHPRMVRVGAGMDTCVGASQNTWVRRLSSLGW